MGVMLSERASLKRLHAVFPFLQLPEMIESDTGQREAARVRGGGGGGYGLQPRPPSPQLTWTPGCEG